MQDFENIYNEYFPRIYFFLRKLCSDELLCEEMTQETFFRAFTAFYRFDGSCELFTWLAAIAKNTWFSYLRKNRIKTVDIELAVSASDESDTPERIISKRLEASRVRRAVEALPPKYRDVVVLRIYGELPFSQIAAMLKISENSAKVIFHRAKQTLRKTLIDTDE